MVQQAAETFVGTEPERLCYNALIQLGKIPGTDFSFQTSLMGGRLERGGLIVDFTFTNPPDLAISVLGVYFHYRLGGGTESRDLMTRELLAGQGIVLVFIDENDLIDDARYYVEQALQYSDHSALATGGTP